MRINVLGPIEVRTERGRLAGLVGQRQRAMLAALALDQGRVVPVARLVAVLWDDHPPATAAAKVQAHVLGLRLALGHASSAVAGPVLTRPPGYLLSGHGVQLDLAEFDNLTARGTAALRSDGPAEASGLFAEALSLWRGLAFADVTSAVIRAAAASLDERRLLAVEAKAEADLALGLCERVTAEVPACVGGAGGQRLGCIPWRTLASAGCLHHGCGWVLGMGTVPEVREHAACAHVN